jgi:hypothetical protein
MLTLAGLSELLTTFAAGETTLHEVRARFAPLVAADPLGSERCDPEPWEDDGHHDQRLLWRLVHLFEHEIEEELTARRLAAHVVRCFSRTGSADVTFELLPLLRDQERLSGIVVKHRDGIISRTGLLNVISASGYPPHVKVWLEHASLAALERLMAMLSAEAYDLVAETLEQAP